MTEGRTGRGKSCPTVRKGRGRRKEGHIGERLLPLATVDQPTFQKVVGPLILTRSTHLPGVSMSHLTDHTHSPGVPFQKAAPWPLTNPHIIYQKCPIWLTTPTHQESPSRRLLPGLLRTLTLYTRSVPSG